MRKQLVREKKNDDKREGKMRRSRRKEMKEMKLLKKEDVKRK